MHSNNPRPITLPSSLLSTLHCLQPTIARRSSESSLGTYSEIFADPPSRNKCSIAHWTSGCFFLVFPPLSPPPPPPSPPPSPYSSGQTVPGFLRSFVSFSRPSFRSHNYDIVIGWCPGSPCAICIHKCRR